MRVYVRIKAPGLLAVGRQQACHVHDHNHRKVAALEGEVTPARPCRT